MDGFKITKQLGKGSYGTVYKVQRESDGELYALKETDLSNASSVERNDAVNEVRLLVSMNDPSVIRYHEAFLHGKKLCVVMEYAPFGDLKYYIAKGQRLAAPFPEEAIWRIFLQLARGLEVLHAAHVMHRDIKPANVFLCSGDLLKIGDFGVAKAMTHRSEFARTQIGTPLYMAPEVWSGRPYSYSSDLWSMGVVLYEMMTHRLPIEARSIPELKAKALRGRYAPIAPGRYSDDLRGVCHALLSLDAKKRPSPATILASPAAARHLPSLPIAAPARGSTPFLSTIVVPRNLSDLPRVLPGASYPTAAAKKASEEEEELEAAAVPTLPSLPPVRVPSPSPSASPSQNRYTSPAQNRSVSPSQNRYASPAQNRSVSPSQHRAASPAQYRGASPAQHRGASPSASPSQKRDASPSLRAMPAAARGFAIGGALAKVHPMPASIGSAAAAAAVALLPRALPRPAAKAAARPPRLSFGGMKVHPMPVKMMAVPSAVEAAAAVRRHCSDAGPTSSPQPPALEAQHSFDALPVPSAMPPRFSFNILRRISVS